MLIIIQVHLLYMNVIQNTVCCMSFVSVLKKHFDFNEAL